MSITKDVRPLLYAATFLGCAPHVINDSDILITKRGAFYTFVWTLLYGGSCVVGMYLIVVGNALEVKLMILTAVRTILSYACLFSDTALTTAWNYKLRAVLAQLRNFDRATKFGERVDNSTLYKSYGALLFVLVFWSAVGYATYWCEPTASLFNGLTYSIINTAISLQIMKFTAMAFLLCQRFRRLCEISVLPKVVPLVVRFLAQLCSLMHGTFNVLCCYVIVRAVARYTFGPTDGKIMMVESTNRTIRLQEIWWLHCCLANAAETVNSVYGVQLLLWIACMSFNTLSRIYTINESHDIPTLLKIREFLLVSACVTSLLIITAICHAVADQANRVGKVIFTPLSPVVGKRNFLQDNAEVAAYFQLREVHFFAAAGLIRIDLPLLLSIASGITTYLVILHTNNV